MNKFIILFTAIVLLSACNNTTETTEETTDVVSNENFIALSDFQAKGAEYLDKEVQTQGIVDHVCRHGGKKILLVADGVSTHVFAEERYDDDLTGKEIIVNGLVKEDRTDEASLLELEESVINVHTHGDDEAKDPDKSEEEIEEELAAQELRQESIIAYVNTMRDSLKNAGVEYFAEYYLEYISHKEVEESKE